MSLIYLTGMSGSGKSTVLRELETLGYETHGVDELGYADWMDRKTGAIIPFPEDEDSINIHDWYKKHRWVLSVDRISKLKQQADTDDKLVFLGGIAEGEEDVWQCFDKVFLLKVDGETIKERIANRTDNDFGKSPDEMAEIMNALHVYEAKCEKLGVTTVDGAQPIKTVIENIIKNL